MNTQSIPFRIEPMKLADIPAVNAVETLSYGTKWFEKAYDYELQKNELAHYFVLRLEPEQTIIGLGGFWLISNEIHINTIAIHPDWRRLGLGEWMLMTLLVQGQSLGAKFATLEVRPSNHAARALYQQYWFQEVGRRPHYYNDGEDALILTTPSLVSPDYQALFTQRKTTIYQRLARIEVE